MRVCHPRPPDLKWSITSRERRMVVDTFGLALGNACCYNKSGLVPDQIEHGTERRLADS